MRAGPFVCRRCATTFYREGGKRDIAVTTFCSAKCRNASWTESARSVEERFWEKVQKTDECWIWVGQRNARGYGCFYSGRRMEPAYRMAWMLANGRDVPEGMSICHTCDNRPCVRPDHLFLGTHADNNADMRSKGRQVHGEGSWNAKLTAEKVVAIRRAYHRGNGVELAKQYGVSHATIQGVVSRRTWREVSA